MENGERSDGEWRKENGVMEERSDGESAQSGRIPFRDNRLSMGKKENVERRME